MLSQQNYVSTVFDEGSKNSPKVMYGLFWSVQEAMAKNETQRVFSLMSKASQENARLPRIFDAFLNGVSDGKMAVFLPFLLIEQFTERRAYNAGRTSETRTDKAFGKYDYLSKADYIHQVIYGPQYGVVPDSPNNVSFWVKVWFALHLRWLGELRGHSWAQFEDAIQDSKKGIINLVGGTESWRVMSPSLMHELWQAKHTPEPATPEPAKSKPAKPAKPAKKTLKDLQELATPETANNGNA